MKRYVVRLGYDYVLPVFRDVTVSAVDARAAASEALALSSSDPMFWAEAIEGDGEPGATTIIDVDENVEAWEGR